MLRKRETTKSIGLSILHTSTWTDQCHHQTTSRVTENTQSSDRLHSPIHKEISTNLVGHPSKKTQATDRITLGDPASPSTSDSSTASKINSGKNIY